jgi:hypothetical protein
MRNIVGQFKKECNLTLQAKDTPEENLSSLFSQLAPHVKDEECTARQMCDLLRHLLVKEEKVSDWIKGNYPLIANGKGGFTDGMKVFYALEQHVCPNYGASAAMRRLETMTHKGDSVATTFYSYMGQLRLTLELDPDQFPSQEAWQGRFMHFLSLFSDKKTKEDIQRLLLGRKVSKIGALLQEYDNQQRMLRDSSSRSTAKGGVNNIGGRPGRGKGSQGGAQTKHANNTQRNGGSSGQGKSKNPRPCGMCGHPTSPGHNIYSCRTPPKSSDYPKAETLQYLQQVATQLRDNPHVSQPSSSPKPTPSVDHPNTMGAPSGFPLTR